MDTRNRHRFGSEGQGTDLGRVLLRVVMAVAVGAVAALGVMVPAAVTTAATPEILAAGGSQFGAQVQPDVEVAFRRQCAGCHGSAGAGDFGLDLRTWSGSIDDASEMIAAGGDGMPGFSATLTEDQITALAELVDELAAATVYRERCVQCHGEWGEGAESGPSLKTSTQDDTDRRSTIADGVGSMPGFSAELTDAQIDALVERTAGYRAIGPTIYGTQCAPCHGPQGQGSTGPALTGAPPAEALTIVESGFGGMPAFGPTLEPGDVEAVVDYALELEPITTTTTTPAITTTVATTPTVAGIPGAEVYAAHCALCHGADAEGDIGPPLVGTDIASETLLAAVRDGQGSMPGFAAVLSDEEIAATVEFVEALGALPVGEPTADGADIYLEQCAACHGDDGRGGLGPSLRTTLLAGGALRTAIAEGSPTMPAFSRTLDAGDLLLVTSYVEGLRGVVDLADAGSELQGGPAIYGQDCSACHGDQGEGGIGPSLQSTPLTVNEIVARVYGGHTAGMPAFEGALDGAQVRDVAHYIKSFQAEDAGEPRSGIRVAIVIAAGLILAGVVAVGVVRLRSRRA